MKDWQLTIAISVLLIGLGIKMALDGIKNLKRSREAKKATGYWPLLLVQGTVGTLAGAAFVICGLWVAWQLFATLYR